MLYSSWVKHLLSLSVFKNLANDIISSLSFFIRIS
nr:MAG TPA: hypothetical protein [Caudoviricetes sp.]